MKWMMVYVQYLSNSEFSISMRAKAYGGGQLKITKTFIVDHYGNNTADGLSLLFVHLLFIIFIYLFVLFVCVLLFSALCT